MRKLYASISSMMLVAATSCATPEMADRDTSLQMPKDYASTGLLSRTSSTTHDLQPGETPFFVVGSGSYSGLAGKKPIDLSSVGTGSPLRAQDHQNSLLQEAKKIGTSISLYESDPASGYPEEAEIRSPAGPVTDKPGKEGIELIIEE